LSYISVHIAVKPLTELTGKLKAMSDGDFTITIDPKGHDEITEIQTSVSAFLVSMRQMLYEITDITQTIKAQADSSSVVSESMLEASKAQADSMSALNNTVDQFSVSITQIAENATDLSGVVAETTNDSDAVKNRIDSTVTISQKGRSDMQRVNEAMNDIRSSITVLVEAINKVGQASKEITGIVGLIGNISEETALLSLNASIEAARAGEAGKGFAVVASEISTLADTTANSVDDISSLIEEVESLIADAVKRADVSVQNINESSERIRVAVNTFDDIYKRIQNVDEVISRMVNEVQVVNSVAMDVSAVSQEQAASTEMIHDTSEKMVEQANELAEESEKVAESARVLTQTSDKLTRQMSRFRV
jgi:methyl-accepting chemotaxis protein